MQEYFWTGSYSNDGICSFCFDNEKINLLSNNSIYSNISYITELNDMIYSVEETLKDCKTLCYDISSIHPNLINYTNNSGIGTCFVCADPTRNMLYTSNYTSGSLDVFNINPDYSVGNLIYTKSFGTNSHLHHSFFSYDYKYLFLIDLGKDVIHCYSVDFNSAFTTLILTDVHSYFFEKGTEPRHGIIENDNKIYIVTEKKCTLEVLDFSLANGFSPILSCSLLPFSISIEDNFTGCAIKRSNDNNYIYVSIRGNNSISVFKIEDSNIVLVQNISCYGKTPRDISFNNDESYLLCANQDSNSISLFSRNKFSGLLEFISITTNINSPTCIYFKKD